MTQYGKIVRVFQSILLCKIFSLHQTETCTKKPWIILQIIQEPTSLALALKYYYSTMDFHTCTRLFDITHLLQN